ncbi:MAG: methyltransferase domain-containing protein [Gammaproteobacteria bacterium]|jgi:ubiquinone/menaquinone biosynthesis C-methylase UbiE
MNVEHSVRERYTQSAREREEALCCPVSYDPGLLDILPEEIIAKDYGCGDPSRYVREGDVVLDLGSGGGKICYLAAQLTGADGQVIGVDINDEMLALARKYRELMADRLGNDRVRFVKGYIQDLALDPVALQHRLQQYPVSNPQEYAELKAWEYRQRTERPLIPDASVDLVISNCVLNLVPDHEKRQLVAGIHRVLKPGGRIAIADIVSDRPVPAELKKNAELWSGCISGAFQDTEFLQVFVDSGFHAVRLDKWEARPWRVVEGIAFHSVTLTAVKGGTAASGKELQEIIYRGPFAEVTDDSGQHYRRGERMAVSGEQFARLTDSVYQDAFIAPGNRDVRDTTACCSTALHSVHETNSGDGGCCG